MIKVEKAKTIKITMMVPYTKINGRRIPLKDIINTFRSIDMFGEDQGGNSFLKEDDLYYLISIRFFKKIGQYNITYGKECTKKVKEKIHQILLNTDVVI